MICTTKPAQEELPVWSACMCTCNQTTQSLPAQCLAMVALFHSLNVDCMAMYPELQLTYGTNQHQVTDKFWMSAGKGYSGSR